MEAADEKKSDKALLVVVLFNSALVATLFLWSAFIRNVDGDEGLYLEAAHLVGKGKLLYSDFFFQQMPLIPYFLAAVRKVFGISLYPARIFCAALSASAAAFVLYYAAKVSRSIWVVSVATVLILGSGIYLAWAAVVKTHPFNAFCLTGSCVLVLLWNRGGGKSKSLLAIAGFMLGVGVNCRLTLVPFPLLFLAYIVFQQRKGWWKWAGWFLLGLLVSSLPTIWYVVRDPNLFLKYNLFYHTRIYPGIADSGFRYNIAVQVFWEPQIAFLMLAAYIAVTLKTFQGWRRLFASDEFFIAAVLAAYIAIHLFTAMPFTQYFSTIVPFLVLLAIPLLELSLRIASLSRAMILAPILIAYTAFSPRVIYHELYSVGSLEPQWRLRNINAAVAMLKRMAKPGEVCLTWWPGYAALAGCQSYPGMENHMREHAILAGVPAYKLREYKLLPGEDLAVALDERKSRLVVDGAYHLDTPYNEYDQYLLNENYRLRIVRGGVKFYTLPTAAELEVEEKSRDVVERLHEVEGNLLLKQAAAKLSSRPRHSD